MSTSISITDMSWFCPPGSSRTINGIHYTYHAHGKTGGYITCDKGHRFPKDPALFIPAAGKKSTSFSNIYRSVTKHSHTVKKPPKKSLCNNPFGFKVQHGNVAASMAKAGAPATLQTAKDPKHAGKRAQVLLSQDDDAAAASTTDKICFGIDATVLGFPLPLGQSFPFARSGREMVGFVLDLNHNTIKSINCKGTYDPSSGEGGGGGGEGPASDGARECVACFKLASHPKLLRFAGYAKHTGLERTTIKNMFLTPAQMQAKHERSRQRMRLQQVRAYYLVRRVGRLKKEKQLHELVLDTLAQGNVPRLDKILGVMKRKGSSLKAILEKIRVAREHMYSAKQYDDFELEFAQFLLVSGGRKVLFAANKLGLCPGLRTLERRRAASKPTFWLSPGGYQTHVTLENCRNMIQYTIEPGKKHAFVLMVDNVAVEEGAAPRQSLLEGVGGGRPQPGPVRMHGFCCNHTGVDANAMVATSYNDLLQLRQGLIDGKIHFATEATVFAIGKIGDAEFTAIPVAVVATCVTDDNHVVMAKMIEDITRYWEANCESELGPMVTGPGSDGGSVFVAAEAHLCSAPIPEDHWLYQLINPCGLLDKEAHFRSRHTTGGCDQKHAAKRARTAWLSEGAKEHLVIGAREIRLHDIRALLVAVGTPAALIHQMIDRREDKGQDVPLLMKLLTELAKLAPHGGTVTMGGAKFTEPSEGIKVGDLPEKLKASAPWSEKIKDAHILGHIAGCFLALLTGKELSLSDHVANLSKLAHLYFTIYRRNGSRYVPPQHYHNVQTMARSVIMSIAVCQHFGVDQYYIFQDSTDRLEQLFGRLRMLQRSNRNFDAVGLVDRILAIVSVQRFFDRNPRLDAGSRKLSGNITDHVNPASWGKSTDPATVNLGVQWNVGAALAGQALTADGVYSAEEVNYAQIATTSDATMLQPLGAAGGRPGVSPAIDRRTH